VCWCTTIGLPRSVWWIAEAWKEPLLVCFKTLNQRLRGRTYDRDKLKDSRSSRRAEYQRRVGRYKIRCPCAECAVCHESTWVISARPLALYIPNSGSRLRLEINITFGSPVGVATGYRPHDRGIEVSVPLWSRIFTPPYRPDRLWVLPAPPPPPSQCVPAANSPGVKRQRRKALHSPLGNAEIKKTWIYTSTPPYVFMA
jgi:hypothetical protein